MQRKRFLLPQGRNGGKPMFLKRFFGKPASPVRHVYDAIVAAARHPRAYADWGVPDTLDGRFDMISLHMFLVLDRLKGRAQGFRQGLVDELFRDMDRSLREMGVGDVSVGKKVRKMAEVFYGRVAAYDRALTEGEGSIGQAIKRNVLAGEARPEDVEALTDYFLTVRRHLAGQTEDAVVNGHFTFGVPAT